MRAFVTEFSLKTHRHTHRRMQLRVCCSSASRLLNFTDVSTWFQMPLDSISERANSKIFLGEHAPRPPTSPVGRVLHVRLAPPTVHLLCRPWYCSLVKSARLICIARSWKFRFTTITSVRAKLFTGSSGKMALDLSKCFQG